LGLISSLHCVGMCGPLAMALPVQHLASTSRNISILLYHCGRIVTYSSLGWIMGLFGRGIYVAGLQQWLSLVTGILIILSLFFYFGRNNPLQPVFMKTFFILVQGWMKTLLRGRNFSAYLLLGMANGLLPCGMVYVALAGAISFNSPLEGSAFMMMYGAGTLPAMIGFTVFGFYMSLKVRNSIKKAQPYLMLFIALILILRGMNLGIPYLSPVLHSLENQPVSCH
jgi:uncharacterized protein